MNTGLRFLVALSLAVLAGACGKDDKAGSPTVPDTAAVDSVAVDHPAQQADPARQAPAPQAASSAMSDIRAVPPMTPYDINDIPVTDKNVGEFPFFAPPKGYRYVTPPLTTLEESVSLREHFHHIYAFGVDRIQKVEGKVLRVALHNDNLKTSSKKDLLLVRRHYRDAIIVAGGVMVYGMDTKTDEAQGASSPKENRAGSESLRSLRQVYVIHLKDSEAWFDVDCSNRANCLLTVTQKMKM